MRAFQAPKGSYILKLNHRKLIDSFIIDVLGIKDETQKTSLIRLLDKYEKLSKHDFETELKDIGITSPEPIHAFMQITDISQIQSEFLSLVGSESLKEFLEIFTALSEL